MKDCKTESKKSKRGPKLTKEVRAKDWCGNPQKRGNIYIKPSLWRVYKEKGETKEKEIKEVRTVAHQYLKPRQRKVKFRKIPRSETSVMGRRDLREKWNQGNLGVKISK